MAVSSAGFKQQCPTCETMVLVKDMRQVGKKIECPKCKDRFVVEEPDDDAAEPETGSTAKAKAKANGQPAPAAKPKAKRFREDDVDDDDTRDEADDGADDEDDDDKGSSKKKAGGSSKMLPIVLAGVGVVVLIVAAVVLILMNRSPSTNPGPAPNPNLNAQNANVPVPNPVDNKKEDNNPNEQAVAKGLPVAGAELTNLLPNDTEHVLHVNFKDVLDPSNPYRDLIFGGGALPDGELSKKLGFAPASVDMLIRADRYTAGGWTYTVIHLVETVDQKAVTDAFNLKPAAPINNQPFFQGTRANPWFE